MKNPITVIINTWWRLVFWWKKRTGWIDLDRVVATGMIISVDNSLSADGDIRFDLKLDYGQEWLVTGFGGRLTYS